MLESSRQPEYIDHEVPDDKSVVAPILAELKRNFLLQTTKDIKFRKQQLQNLIRGHFELKATLDEALRRDLGYNTFTAQFNSHGFTEIEMRSSLDNIDKWAKPESVDLPIVVGVGKAYVRPEPLGVALVISAWNYPIYTALPFVAVAIAAGNCVILKPSEVSPNTSNVLKQMFDTYLDPRFYRCIEGKVEVAKTLSSSKVDLILFTGSTRTGNSVAVEAAKNLIPCVLELGGKCPVIVDKSANLSGAAKRILMGRFMNCGQTCVAGDYVYVHNSVKAQLIRELTETLKVFYDPALRENGEIGKIITKEHVKRLEGYLRENHGGEVVAGGEIVAENQYIKPTIVVEPSETSSLMTEEIFGPILPVVGYDDLTRLIALINSKPKPLVVYCFSQDSEVNSRLNNQTTSGSFVVNDVVVQLMNPELPFGGVGGSGYGRYHGKSGFLACSNMKSCMEVAILDMYPMSNRFPPYTASKQKIMLFLIGKMGKVTLKSVYKTLLSVIVLIALAKLYKKARYGGM